MNGSPVTRPDSVEKLGLPCAETTEEGSSLGTSQADTRSQVSVPLRRTRSEFIRVAETVIETARRPLSPRQIVDMAQDRALFSDRIAGKTPHQTLKAKLSVEIRKYGESSLFVRTSPGRFYLRRLLDSSVSIYQALPIRPPNPREQVLVLRASVLDSIGRFQGIIPSFDALSQGLLNPSSCTYLDRYEAEVNDEYKQVLTYINVVRRGKVLSFKRGTYNRVADFLRGSRCIGFGGHVTEADRTLFDQADMGVRASAVRELAEELRLSPVDTNRMFSGNGLQLVGILNDDSSDVGRKHIAFVFRFEASDDERWDRPERGEKAITQLAWLDPVRSASSLWDFEYWSQLCLREFFSVGKHVAATYRIWRREGFNRQHVLCVIGALGSGKSEATRALELDFGYSVVNTGSIVAEILGIPPVPQTPREVFQDAAWTFIQSDGGARKLAVEIRNRIDVAGRPNVLVDGIRQMETLDHLRELVGESRVHILYVHTLPDVAYEFFRDRERNISFLDYLRLRNSPVEADVPGLIGDASVVLYNWSGKVPFHATINTMMQELLKRGGNSGKRRRL